MNSEILNKLLPLYDTGIKIIKSDMLPSDTIMVSPELFELLKTVPLDKDKEKI